MSGPHPVQFITVFKVLDDTPARLGTGKANSAIHNYGDAL
jgi:hypothetical protein